MMGYALVLFVALAVGAAVYVVTARNGSVAFGSHRAGGDEGEAYVPVGTAQSDWQTRMTGVLGLLIVVVAGAIAAALGAYALVEALTHLVG
jgi:hypothetical protein